jgi:Disulphide bond corrector protein DsbC
LPVEEGKPKVLPDLLFQQPTGFFEGTAEFTLHLQMAKSVGDRPALHILLRYQSCNDRICLPPHTDTIEVPVGIGR